MDPSTTKTSTNSLSIGCIMKVQILLIKGNLVTDTKEGLGKLKLSNGEIFEGEFRHDMIEGKGKFFTVSGEIISGIWKESKLLTLL